MKDHAADVVWSFFVAPMLRAREIETDFSPHLPIKTRAATAPNGGSSVTVDTDDFICNVGMLGLACDSLRAEITSRWIDSWGAKGTPRHGCRKLLFRWIGPSPRP